MNDSNIEFHGGKRIIVVAGAFALLGIAALIVGGILEPAQFFFAYLTAYAYVVSIALGALIFLMIIHAMHAGWPTLLRRLNRKRLPKSTRRSWKC